MTTRHLVAATAAACVVLTAHAQPEPVIGPQVRLDFLGGTAAANETTAAASERTPGVIVAGWNDWRLSPPDFELINTGFALSSNGGASYVDFLLRPPAANQSSVEGDPFTAFDPVTGTLWAGGISFSAGSNSGIYVARKAPSDTSFQPSVMARTTSGTDKPWMVAGPRPGEPGTTRLYIAYNEGVIRSDDLGDTWTVPSPVAGGIGLLPRVGPGGELYIAYWDFSDGMNLARSFDGGDSFTTHTIATRMDVWSTQNGSRFPGTFRVPSLVTLDVGPDGTLYATYFDTTSFSGGNANVDIYFTRSTDQGTTWTTPTILSADGSSTAGDQFFPFIEADDDGRLHVVYFDSRHTVQNDDVVNGMFDAYYAYSVNGGDTWKEYRLTPSSWNSDNDGLDRPSQFLGDYLGIAVAGRKAHPVYLDTSNGDTDVYSHVIELPVPGDIDGDGFVSFVDLLAVLSAWGPCTLDCCPEDLDGDGEIDFNDLLIVLASWSD